MGALPNNAVKKRDTKRHCEKIVILSGGFAERRISELQSAEMLRFAQHDETDSLPGFGCFDFLQFFDLQDYFLIQTGINLTP